MVYSYGYTQLKNLHFFLFYVKILFKKLFYNIIRRRRKMKKIKVDEELCTGCGICADICPEVFEMQDDLSVVKTSEASGEIADKVKEAQESCPTEAITSEE